MRNLLLITAFILGLSFVSANNSDNEMLISKLEIANGQEKLNLLIKLTKNYGFKSFKISEKYARQAEKLALQLNNDSALINIYRLLGASKQYRGQYDSAIYYFKKSVEVSKKINNELEIARSTSNIAVIYANNRQYDKAEEIYLSSLKVLEKFNDTVSVAMVFDNLGMIYRLKQDYEKSIKYYRKALSLAKTNTVKYAVMLSNIAEDLFLMSDVDSALNLYFKAIKIFENNNNKYYISINYKRIADIYFSINDLEKAKLYCLQSLSIAKELDSKSLEYSAYQLLIDIERKAGNYKQALLYYDDFQLVKDSLDKKKSNKLINELKIQYETELKDAEIKQKTLKLKSKNNILIALSIGFIVAGILIVLLVLQIKKLKLAYEKLVEQNKNIVSTENEIDKLKQKLPVQNEIDDDNELLNRIIELVEKEKVYLDKNLTIFKFADLLDTNKTYVSQEINKNFNKNFSNFINDYRVMEARRLMTMPEYRNLTLAAIAEKAGFNSISVFNRSFKRVTGITPSYFLKSIK